MTNVHEKIIQIIIIINQKCGIFLRASGYAVNFSHGFKGLGYRRKKYTLLLLPHLPMKISKISF